jgi:hypothetical protein
MKEGKSLEEDSLYYLTSKKFKISEKYIENAPRARYNNFSLLISPLEKLNLKSIKKTVFLIDIRLIINSMKKTTCGFKISSPHIRSGIVEIKIIFIQGIAGNITTRQKYLEKII